MRSTHPRILCVDDDGDNAELVCLMLRSSDAAYEVESVTHPDEALKLVAEGEFDLYILDYRYPHTTGVEVCKQIKEVDPQAPVMFFTGEARERLRE